MAYNVDFLSYLEKFKSTLPSLSLQNVFNQPNSTALVIVDLVKGFCTIGPLSSPRVDAIVTPGVALLTAAWEQGVRDFVFTHDAHEADAVEFSAFPPHCIRGTVEAEIVPAIMALPFFDRIKIIKKNSISSNANTSFAQWMEQHKNISTFIILGDCTDICVYQMAMYLKTDANSRQLKRRVIVPVNCVDTYDMSVEIAGQVGAMPHDAALVQDVFLYHMLLNDVEVVKNIK
jgi:nicotinamidase-related amidase